MNARRPSSPTLHVSFILATHNRRDIVRNTIERIHDCGIPRADFDIIVVDNASTDGTPDAAAPLCDNLIRLNENKGSCAKSLGVAAASGRFIVFLDDDSFPRPGSIGQMIAHFEADTTLGAAGFTVHLPDRRLEASALPGVFHGAGVGFRAEALRDVGNLDLSFFMQAEEYDLSFRLVNRGWTVRIFDDLHVEHLKSPQARRSDRTTYYDTRNNLCLIARYLPPEPARMYREDWLQRYRWLAEMDGHPPAFRRGRRDGTLRAYLERIIHRRQRLTSSAFEFFFRWDETRRKMADLAGQGTRRIVLADLGKNIYAFHRAACEVGIEIAAIADDRFCGSQHWYRGSPILSSAEALQLPADAIVISNMAAPFATQTHDRLKQKTTLPIHCWFGLLNGHKTSSFGSARPRQSADERLVVEQVMPALSLHAS